MEYTTFSEAPDFAMGRERAAIVFYEALMATAEFAAQKATLAEFRAMEQGHLTKLGTIKARGEVKLSAKSAADLGLAKLLDDSEAPDHLMTFQEILVSAIKKEERSNELYVKLSESAHDSELKAVFELLAIEEGRHKHYFETLYDSEVARDN